MDDFHQNEVLPRFEMYIKIFLQTWITTRLGTAKLLNFVKKPENTR